MPERFFRRTPDTKHSDNTAAPLLDFNRFAYMPETVEPMPTTLLEFAAKFTYHYAEQWESGRPRQRHVLLLDSAPGSGKTFTYRNVLKPYMESVCDRVNQTYRDQAPQASFEYLQYDALDAVLIHYGVIKPPNRKLPYPEEDLRVVSGVLERIAAYKISDQEEPPEDIAPYVQALGLHKNKENSILVIEKPGITAVKTDIAHEPQDDPIRDVTWIVSDRYYAPQLADKLVAGIEPFHGIRRDDVYLAVLSAAGGPTMDFYANRRHDGATRKQLKRIREVNRAAVRFLLTTEEHQYAHVLPEHIEETIVDAPKLLRASRSTQRAVMKQADPDFRREISRTARLGGASTLETYLNAIHRMGEPLVTFQNYTYHDWREHQRRLTPDLLFVFYNEPPLPRYGDIFRRGTII